MAYKHVIRAKTKNLFNVNSEWERVIAPLTDVNLSIEGNTISGVDLGEGVSAIISPTKIPISTNKVYYTSGQCSGQPSILVRLTDESGEVLTTGIAETYYPYNQYYKAFIVYLNGTFSITNDNAKYLQLGLRFAKGTSTSTRVTFTNVQVELGSTPTPYTPYNYLQSNKRMIKVSDVCQLLDKSEFPATTTTNGVTFTNNGDGSITVDGTATADVYYDLTDYFSINMNHKYIILESNSGTGNRQAFISTLLDDNRSRYGGYYPSNGIFKFASYNGMNPIKAVGTFYASSGEAFTNRTISNFMFFDLTEMYGAGHEPATVAEFRQRFPNEYYPYSPQCWLTSYKSAVVCKTKNLFDVNNAVPYRFGNDNPDSNLLWLKDGIYTTRINNYNLGSGLRIKNGLSLPAGTYTVSAKIVDFNNVEKFVIGFRYKTTDGTWKVSSYPYEKHKVGATIALRVILPENTDVRLYLTYQNNNGQTFTGYVSYKDIQLEKGSTATSYVPYQHL